jgi:hypothetical protein
LNPRRAASHAAPSPVAPPPRIKISVESFMNRFKSITEVLFRNEIYLVYSRNIYNKGDCHLICDKKARKL